MILESIETEGKIDMSVKKIENSEVKVKVVKRIEVIVEKIYVKLGKILKEMKKRLEVKDELVLRI